MGDELKLTFRRHCGLSYMVIFQTEDTPFYEEEMLKNNDIAPLLPFFAIFIEGQKQLWYDITGKKSLNHVFEQSELSAEDIYRLFQKIIDARNLLSDFLIPDTHILLNEDTIYITGSGNDLSIYLCYNPDEKISREYSIDHIFEYLMPIIDQNDDSLVNFIYEGYSLTSDDSFSWSKLGEFLSQFQFSRINKSAANHDFSEASSETEIIDYNNTQETLDRSQLLEALYEDVDEDKDSFFTKIRKFFSNIPT